MTDTEVKPSEPISEVPTAALRGSSRREARRDEARFPGHLKRNPAWVIAAIVLAVLVCAIGADIALSWDRIHPGVRVGGVAVGSMTPQQARSALEKSFALTSALPVNVTWQGKGFAISAAQIGARLDTTPSVIAAMAVGRSGSVFEVVTKRIVAVFAGVDIGSNVRSDETATAAALDPIAAAVAQPATDASVSISGTTIKVLPSRTGRALDRVSTMARVFTAFLAKGGAVEAVVTEALPAVSDDAAQTAAEEANSLISSGVRVTYETRSLDIPREAVARMLVFVRSGGTTDSVPAGSPVTLAGSFDATRLASAVSSLTSGMGRPAKDASFAAEKGSVRVVPAQVGRGPDTAMLAADLLAACRTGGTRTAALRFKETQPALTTEAAKDMGISERISTFTTSYSTVNPARTNNVHLLARAFDGKLIAPGAVFSFNGTAGQRTAAKGYQEAPAIVKGKLVPQLGGGVCQVGSTFFNTVFFSGLPIVERHNHSFYISHYPKGRDATVSWGGPDFKFKNTTPNWILIRTAVTASTLTISLYGTDPGYHVEYTTGPFTDVVPHSVEEIKDPTMLIGKRVVEDGGVDGCQVVVRRTVYLGGQVVTEDTFVSHYSPKLEVVRVGTKPSTTPTGTVGP